MNSVGTIGSWIKTIYEKIEARYKVCFISGIICGLLAHIYAMTNHLYNYDEIWHTPTGFGTGTEVGRWALSITVYIQKILFGDCYTIPVINGLITLFFYTLAACFVVSVLDIQDEFFAGITGALMLTFPALTCRMFFMFTTHYYAIGIFLVAFGVWIFVNRKCGKVSVLVAMVLVVYGMAIYQANFVTAVCMLVGYLLVSFIKNDYELSEAIKKCVYEVLFLGFSMLFFLIGSKVALFVTGKEMQTYENLDTMGQLSVSQAIEGILKCYKTFLKLPIKDVYAMNPSIIVKMSFFISFVVFLITLVRMLLIKKQIHVKILIFLIMLVIPVAVNLIAVMAISSGTMYSIMVYEIVFVLVFAIACLEALRACESFKLFNPVRCVASIALLATIGTYIWFSNGNYISVEYTNMHDNAYYTVLMSQIKSTPGYSDEMPMAIVGIPGNDKTLSIDKEIYQTFNIDGRSPTNLVAYSHWNIMTKILGFDPNVKWSDEDEEYFANHPSVKDMPHYPDDGSIQIIEDTLVIKF